MKHSSFLDLISVPKPCSETWDNMVGGNQSRHCQSCSKDVHNLSEMSSKQAEKLIFSNKGGVCVRMTRNADGKVQTNDRKFHQIKRKSRIAANILSITLALSAITSAQTENTGAKPQNTDVKSQNTSVKLKNTQQNLLTLTISDENQGVVAGMQVKIIDLQTKTEQIGRSNDNGELQFVIDKLGSYEIVVISGSGFKELKKIVELTKDNLRMTLQLEVKDSLVGTGVESNGQTITMGYVMELPKTVDNTRLLTLQPINLKQSNHKTSQISFTILDQTGALIPNAEVKLTHEKTKQEFIVKTNEEGVAYFSLLPRGKYQVEAPKEGFINRKIKVNLKKETESNIAIKLAI